MSEHIGKKILMLSHKIKRELGKQPVKHGLTGIQSRIIHFIFQMTKNGEEVYQKDIEKAFDLRAASVTGILNNLEKNKYIERVQNLNDARYKKLNLTKIAIELHDIIMEDINSLEGKIKSSLTKEEIIIFINLIDKIYNNL